jgi:hypothetical protein
MLAAAGCRRALRDTVGSCWMAVLRPEWVTWVPEVSKSLRQRVSWAREGGVFHFAYTFCESVPALYIRPVGLYKQVVAHLTTSAQSPGSGNNCVLIWGAIGAGKTSLARDVAHAFAFGETLPEGVWRCPCVLSSLRVILFFIIFFSCQSPCLGASVGAPQRVHACDFGTCMLPQHLCLCAPGNNT